MRVVVGTRVGYRYSTMLLSNRMVDIGDESRFKGPVLSNHHVYWFTDSVRMHQMMPVTTNKQPPICPVVYMKTLMCLLPFPSVACRPGILKCSIMTRAWSVNAVHHRSPKFSFSTVSAVCAA